MTLLPIRFVRLKLTEAGVLPLSRLARLTLLLLGLDALIWVVQQVLLAARKANAAGGLDVWIALLTLAGSLLLFFLSVRWIRRVFLWRLRNRLLITYLFIGVIPVALVAAMALLAGYLLAAQFSIFIANSDFHTEVDELEAANSAIAAHFANDIRQGDTLLKAAIEEHGVQLPEDRPGMKVTAWYRGRPAVLSATKDSKPIPRPAWLHGNFKNMTVDEDNSLHLRAVTTIPIGSGALTVISNIPIDAVALSRIGKNLGQINLILGKDVDVNVQIHSSKQFNMRGGSIPPAARALDREVVFANPLQVVNWQTGKDEEPVMLVMTRASVLYRRLFSKSTDLAGAITTALVGIAITFAVIELFALFVGIGLTRTITRSVAALYQGTERVNRGDFRHRIEVKSADQLATLETSFNSMTASLENLIAEQKEKQRLQSELAIAQEVQGQLFPKSDLQMASLELHGVCLPARTVSGDYYDFLPLGSEKMCIALGDISGKGISAALLMATVHSAVRVYEFGGMPDRSTLAAAGAAAMSAARLERGLQDADLASLGISSNGSGIHSPSEVLRLLNRHLFHSTPPEKYATLFLGIFDGTTSRLTYSNAGHLPPLVIGVDQEVRKLETGGTVIGLFDNRVYEESSIDLRKGDLFVAYSDGITEPENEFGEFGEARLLEILLENHDLPLARLSELVTTAVQDWNGGAEQPDDVTLVLARAC